jgi:hypothetical protein
MLSHAASTAGLRPKELTEYYDEESLVEGWRSMRTNSVFATETNQALKQLCYWIKQNGSKIVAQPFETS